MKNKDFTLSTNKELLKEFTKANCSFQTLEQYCNVKIYLKCLVILRHDVYRKPRNALKLAKIEDKLGIKASYYFRINKKSNQTEIIKPIV
ncbi:MAG: hypothetical protein ACTSRP_18495 [Candidatus Helarchaeota archaeon]